MRARRSGRPLGLLMIDLDDFKLVNDTFGHLYGDDVLGWTAEVIRSTLRASDIAARYGGDEFAIILPELGRGRGLDGGRPDRGGAGRRQLPAARSRAVPVTAAIGAASFPADGRTPQELIARADDALYTTKRTAERGAQLTLPIAAADRRDGRDPDSSSRRG